MKELTCSTFLALIECPHRSLLVKFRQTAWLVLKKKKMKILPHANWRLIGDDEGFVLISRLLHTDIDLYYIKLSQKNNKTHLRILTRNPGCFPQEKSWRVSRKNFWKIPRSNSLRIPKTSSWRYSWRKHSKESCRNYIDEWRDSNGLGSIHDQNTRRNSCARIPK